MTGDRSDARVEKEQVIPTTCSSHCGGVCLLKVHVKDGVITRVETDDGEEPQLRGCLRGRAYRQRVYDPGRILYPLKRVGARGEGRFERISWDEALDTVARELKGVRDTYGPASILMVQMPGDTASLTGWGALEKLLNMAGGFTMYWGAASFNAALYSAIFTYGTLDTSNTSDDLLNSRLIILWGTNPADTICGTNTFWYLAQAREAGARIVAVDPRFTDTAAALADEWIPIRPGTDAAMLIAMAYVMIKERLHDEKFLETYTVGFDRYKDYVMGAEDGVPKTPAWAEETTGVPSANIESLARKYATVKPAALLASNAPGRTAYGEQYHRAAITLAAMTGNVGIRGGNAAAMFQGGPLSGFPYLLPPVLSSLELWDFMPNPLEQGLPGRPEGVMVEFALGRKPRIHVAKIADAILTGRAGGYFTDYKLLYVKKANYINSFPNVNKIVRALRSQSLEFIVVEEQVMTATAKYADIVLPVNTFMEREDMAYGQGLAFIGKQNKVIEPLGESKSPLQITAELAERMGITGFLDKTEEELLRYRAQLNSIPDYGEWTQKAVHWLNLPEPHVAFKSQIEDPANNPFPTPSGKIEIYSERIADMGDPLAPPIPKYIETWESRKDPLVEKYSLQLITTHFKRRTNAQFETVPWLRELQKQAVLINLEDARARDIQDGQTVRVFNDRGEIVIRARVTERVMPGVVDVPQGAWHDPDGNGVDRGACANVLTKDEPSPGGAFAYNTALVEVEKIAGCD
jgi:anaerobic dimethyl sulfoxide reductase subunit A